jgi:capsular polysaccharide biosynthesis protein
MVDLMPAFRMLKTHDDYGLRHATLLINHSERSYQRECIEALSLEVDVINARPYTLYSSAHLYARELPRARSRTGGRFCFTIQDAHFLRSVFNVQESDASIDLYVVRGHTQRRRIRNESEVIALMGKLGFRIFDPAGHSVYEQARQFASARKIIGFHGAGLVNTIFCGKQTKFIEIFDNGYAPDPSGYSKIASRLGLEYHRIVHDTGLKHRLAGIAEDISVDVDALEAELKCVI